LRKQAGLFAINAYFRTEYLLFLYILSITSEKLPIPNFSLSGTLPLLPKVYIACNREFFITALTVRYNIKMFEFKFYTLNKSTHWDGNKLCCFYNMTMASVLLPQDTDCILKVANGKLNYFINKVAILRQTKFKNRKFRYFELISAEMNGAEKKLWLSGLKKQGTASGFWCPSGEQVSGVKTSVSQTDEAVLFYYRGKKDFSLQYSRSAQSLKVVCEVSLTWFTFK